MPASDTDDRFAAQRARAIGAEPALPKRLTVLEQERAWAPLIHAAREAVLDAVRASDAPGLFDDVGSDPFDRANGKTALRLAVLARLRGEIVEPLPTGRLRKLRSALVEPLKLDTSLLMKRDAGLLDDVLGAVDRIVAADIESRFPAR